MEVKQNDDGKKGVFIAVDVQDIAGEMTYVWTNGNTIILDHTEVDSKYGGKGVGKLLVAEAVKFARENHVKIAPVCPFTKKMFERELSWSDVLV